MEFTVNVVDGKLEIYCEFPIFPSHEIAASHGCIGCGSKLDPANAQDKGYPPGHGRYGNHCSVCTATFFYDLEVKS